MYDISFVFHVSKGLDVVKTAADVAQVLAHADDHAAQKIADILSAKKYVIQHVQNKVFLMYEDCTNEEDAVREQCVTSFNQAMAAMREWEHTSVEVSIE